MRRWQRRTYRIPWREKQRQKQASSKAPLTELRWKRTFLLWLVPLMFTVMLAGFGVVINLLFRLIAAR